MNVFKLALALWLSFGLPFVLVASSFSPANAKSTNLFFLDSTACQARVQIPIPIDQFCAVDTSLLRSSLDFDIQDLNGDSVFALNDFIPDVVNANHLFSRRDTSLQLEGEFPAGFHALRLELTDTCGNSYQDFIPFQVSDTTTFRPICKPGIRVHLESLPVESDLDNDGFIDLAGMSLFSDDFLAEDNFDCAGQRRESESRFGTIIDLDDSGISLLNNGQEDYLFFSCAYLSRNTTSAHGVEIIATDNQGREGSCFSYISVDYSSPEARANCGYFEPQTIFVDIQTLSHQPVPDTEIRVSGLVNYTEITTPQGYLYLTNYYDFPVTITPFRDIDAGQGISTMDILLLRQHILDIAPLSSPMQQLAADVNGDQRLTVRDVVEMQRILLGIQDKFVNNQSWRFFDSKFRFPDPNDPWAGTIFQESWTVDTDSNYVNVGIFAIKIGDLDGSAFGE